MGTNWKNAQGSSTSPDILGQRLVAGVSGSASLQRMPAGNPNGANDDALYVFWQEDDSDQLRWSKAQVNSLNYAAWATPVVKASVLASTSGLATAVDPSNRGIVVHYHNTGDERNRLYRKSGLDDTETTLWTATQVWGTQASLGVARGDVYVYYKKANGNIARLRYLPGPPFNGWETAETIIATATNSYPSMRQDMSNGDGNVAWARVNGVGGWDLKVEPFPSGRPLINRFAVIPSAFDPSVGETATVSYSLKDGSATLTVTVRVYDAQNVLVRTLVNASQSTGAQSVVWDGKNDAGAVLPAGVYTVKANETDPVGLEAPEATATARIGAINYSYDRLYRLTGVSGAAPATTYSYDPVGNRSSMVRGTTTNYTYDRADRITAAGATSYTVNADGNLTNRGADSFTYDQPNRLTTLTIGGAASSYTYDGDGKRATRTSGGLTTSYTYDVNRSLPVVLDDGGRKYVWGLGLVYSVQGTSVEVYHADGLGSVRAVTDAYGDVTQTYTRDEFGVPTSTQGASNQPFGFTGEQRDPESGFMYLRARMYEPGIGRFLQRDIVEGARSTPLTLNRFIYVEDNPISLKDPAGLGPNRIMQNRTFRALSVQEPAQDFVEVLRASLPGRIVWRQGNIYQVELGSGTNILTFTVYENVGLPQRAVLDLFGAEAIVFRRFEIYVRGDLPFGEQLYLHEVGHILQQVRMGAMYWPNYVAAFQQSGGNWCSNWMEIEASELGGVPGYNCPAR